MEGQFQIEFCDGDGSEDAYCSIDKDGNPIDGMGGDETVSAPIRQLRFNETASGEIPAGMSG